MWNRLFPVWRGRWKVSIAGRDRTIDVEWDVSLLGGGCVLVDGDVAVRWRLGMKGFPASKKFAIDGVACVIDKGAGVWGPARLVLTVGGQVVMPVEHA